MGLLNLGKPSLGTFTRVIILAAFYVLAGILGKQASFMSGTVYLVWPPAGIALAAVLLFGYRYWAGVAVGAVLFAVVNGQSMGVFTIGVAVGNTVGALLCAWLLERFVGFQTSMERVRDVAGLVGLACALGTTVNATFNAVAWSYESELSWNELFQSVLEWWVPNAIACLVVTPFILSWGTPLKLKYTTQQVVEGLICGIGLALSTLISFNTWLAYGVQNYPLAFLPYPFLVWLALRFGQRGASFGTLLISVLAIWSLLQGRGPFVTDKTKESLTLIGSYIGILAITNMMLAAAAIERRWAEEALRRSEEMFKLISENASDLIAVTDSTGNRIYNSPSYKNVLGDPDALSGTNAFEQIHPDDRDRIRNVFHETVETGKGQRIEYRFLLRDGSMRYIESQGNYVQGAAGQPGKVVTVARDITDRKRDEESLRLLASAVKFAHDVIVITTADPDPSVARIVFANPGFSRMTGYSNEEVIGKGPSILFGPKTDPAFLHQLRENLSQGKLFQGESINYRKDGTEYYNEWLVEAIKDEAGRTTHLLAIQRDVTGRKQIEADLANARDVALASARLKAEFLANMSHEIRTPMNGIIGMTNLLLHTDLNAQQHDFAGSIRTSAEALLSIINDILDFSKIEAGKLTFEILDFDLRDTVEGAIELLAQQAENKSIELIGSVHPEVPTQLRGDPVRLRQILNNLISNAVKFTERGEVTVRVSRQKETETHAFLRFEVKDNGIGIPPEVQPRLFQAFTQADGSTTRKYGGTGLGLAICKQLVNMMDGQIGLESTQGQGSTFWFVVPLEKQKAAVSIALPDLPRVRVLIVDDNSTSRQVLRQQVTAWRLHNDSASSGSEALRMLRAAAVSDPYGLVIFDMHMPEMDGLMLAQLIKGDSATTNARLIMLTSLKHQLDTDVWKSAGVDACLVKPVKQSRLLDVMMTVLSGRAARAATGIRAAPGAPAQAKTARPIRILLAEDNFINQKVALGQLQEMGYGADVASNGREVLEALQKSSYDIILMDCQMPELDGYEASVQIRQREKEWSQAGGPSQHIHIIAMTANAMRGDREKCLAAGMDDYVSKPVEEEELAAALGRWQPPAAPEPTPAPAPVPTVVLQAPPQTVVAPPPVAPVVQPVQPEPPPVDVRRLRRVALDDPERIRELIELYRGQNTELLAALGAAVESGSAPHVVQAAHKLCGSSSSCGMVAVVATLREMERIGREGQLDTAKSLYEQVVRQSERVLRFLDEYVNSLPKA